MVPMQPRAMVFRMLGNHAEAEDACQEVFILVWKSIDSFRGDAKFSTWLYRIAANHCKNRLKYLSRRSYGTTGELDEVAEHALHALQVGGPASVLVPHVDGPEAAVAGQQAERLLQEAIARLEPEQRELLVLRDVEDLSYDEIAQITGLPEGTVKSRLHRARMALKAHLSRHLGD